MSLIKECGTYFYFEKGYSRWADFPVMHRTMNYKQTQMSGQHECQRDVFQGFAYALNL